MLRAATIALSLGLGAFLTKTDWSAVELDHMAEWAAKTEPIAGGLRLTVTARTPEDTKTVARIRGLGFAGLLVQGGHHGPHHLAMAKGQALPGHRH